MKEDEMVRWHHRLNEHEFEQTPGDTEAQKSLACCNPLGHKELDMTELQQMVFPVVINCCENWAIKKAEQQRIYAFKL